MKRGELIMLIIFNRLLSKKSIIGLLCILIVSSCMVSHVNGSSTGSNSGESSFKVAINGLGSGINLKEACVEPLSDNSCDIYIKDGTIICLNGARIAKVLFKDLSDDTITQALSPYGMEINITAEKDNVYIVYSKQGYVGAVLFSNINTTGNIYEGIAVSTVFSNAVNLDDALKSEDSKISQNQNIGNSSLTESKKIEQSQGIGEKKIQITLNGTGKGVNLQGGCLQQVSNDTTDFYINNGTIICLNGAKINGVSSQNVNSSSLDQVLSSDNLKNSMEARTNMVYTVISPRGYFGVAVFTDIDKYKNIYNGIAISSSLDNALKQQIIETSKKDSTDSASSTGMDVFETGGMDVLTGGGYDYFDTDMSNDITKVVFEGKQVHFKISPREYSDGEILVLLKDIAPLFGITTNSKIVSGIEKTAIIKGLKTVSVQGYSDKAYIGTTETILKRAPKMDSNGILVPLSLLSKNFGIHFTISENNKALSLSKNPIVEWKYAGYNNKKPYAEYESKYVDGVKTTITRTNGKNHVFKNITLYNIKTGKTKTVPENQVDLYKKEWSTTPINSGKASNTSSSTNTINLFYTKMNMHRFFQSNTFNTWGGQMIRRIAP